jgi:hypothetical protein
VVDCAPISHLVVSLDNISTGERQIDSIWTCQDHVEIIDYHGLSKLYRNVHDASMTPATTMASSSPSSESSPSLRYRKRHAPNLYRPNRVDRRGRLEGHRQLRLGLEGLRPTRFQA